MAYVLLPDGFTLKKVSKPEQNAVDEYFGRERRSDYLDKLIQNPQIITIGLGIITGILVKQALEDVDIPIPDKDAIVTAYQKSLLLTNPITAPIKILEQLGIVDIPTTKAELDKLAEDLGFGKFL
jgi:hypothetical protein